MTCGMKISVAMVAGDAFPLWQATGETSWEKPEAPAPDGHALESRARTDAGAKAEAESRAGGSAQAAAEARAAAAAAAQEQQALTAAAQQAEAAAQAQAQRAAENGAMGNVFSNLVTTKSISCPTSRHGDFRAGPCP